MKARSGFTFIEIVAALAILAIGIMAILAIFPVGIESSKRAAVKTKAAILGEMKIESIKATTTFATLADITKQKFTEDEDPERNYQFSAAVTGVNLSDGTTGKLKKLAVTVYWPAKETEESKQQKAVYTTYVANR